MNESLVGHIVLAVFIGGFFFLAIKYICNFRQLQKAYAESGLEWPTLTREQMLAEGSIKGLYKSFAYTFKMWGMILFSRSKDTRIRTPLRKVRLTLLLFALFPFFLGFLLLIGLRIIPSA